MDELRDVKASLELGKRDNLSPVLSAVALLLVGLYHHKDWTDAACIVWGLSMGIYFLRRGYADRAVHQRAKAIIESKR